MADLDHGSKRSIGHRIALDGTVVAIAILLASLALRSPAYARCGDNVGDTEDVETVRTQLAVQCPCAAAQTHGEYMACSRTVIDQAVAAQTLSPDCKSAVRRCQAKSTCGNPGYRTCCRTSARGTTRCSIKRDASRCTAPRGGSACVSDYESSCDACTNGGCNYKPTPTPTATPTLTPTKTYPPFCVPQVEAPLATVPFTIGNGSPDCASNPPAPPITGQVEDGNGTVLQELGAGCLYAGNFPGATIPDGGTAQLDVTGINGLTLTLGPSAGNGPFDCTQGSGPDKACLNGAPGTDGNGACTTATDCGGGAGVCGLKPNCYFGPPIPVGGIAPACVVNSFLEPLCGNLDLATTEVTMASALTAAVFLTNDPNSPCPRCLSGVCSGGPNAGNACTPVGSAQTSVDCPPAPNGYRGKLTVVLPDLTTGTSELVDDAGFFCPGQVFVGAFNLPAARRVAETGAGIGSGGLGAPFATTLAGVFCVPKTGDVLLDSAGFPGVGGFSAVGEIDLTGVIGLPPLP